MAIFLRKLKKPVKNILISRTDRIGDFVLTLPVFEALKKEAEVRVTVLCQKMVAPLLENNPFVDHIITIDRETPDDQLVKAIKTFNFDSLLVLVNDPVIRRLIPQLKFIPVRIGPLSKLNMLFNYTHPVIQKRSKSTRNEAEYNLELVRQITPDVCPSIKPKVYMTEDERCQFKVNFPIIDTFFQVKPCIAFHCGMNNSALNWSIKNYTALLKRLVDRNFHIILTGASDIEKETNQLLIESLVQEQQCQVLNIAGKVSLRELTILLSRCDLFIGPSTGPTHVANACGIPVISFYPPIQVQSRKRWEPFLATSEIFVPDVPCGQKYRCLKEKCSHFYCMDIIQPAAVEEAVVRLLKKD